MSVPKFLFLGTKSTLSTVLHDVRMRTLQATFLLCQLAPYYALPTAVCGYVCVCSSCICDVCVYVMCVYVLVCGVYVHGRVLLYLVTCVGGMCICVCGMHVWWLCGGGSSMCVGGEDVGGAFVWEVTEGEC